MTTAMKTIYLVYDRPTGQTGDWYQECPTFDKAEAVKAAQWAWSYLTKNERACREVYVGVHRVPLPEGDTRTAAQVYDDMLDDDTWPVDHDIIQITEEDAE